MWSGAAVAVTWVVAELECVKRGGHLPSIHSQADYDAVKEVVGGTDWATWIGGHDRVGGGPGRWAWTDGTPWDWEDWRTAAMEPQKKQEPSDAPGEDCVIQHTSYYPPGGVEQGLH